MRPGLRLPTEEYEYTSQLTTPRSRPSVAVREVPLSEFGKLERKFWRATAAVAALQVVTPAYSSVVVAEQGGEQISCETHATRSHRAHDYQTFIFQIL